MPPDTGRLTFREMAPGDLGYMAALLGDPEVMTYYPRPKTQQEAAQWIDWNRRLYRTRGYGLWLLATAAGDFAGDCGLTPQVVDGVTELEVGYHVVPALQGRGGLPRLRAHRPRRQQADRDHPSGQPAVAARGGEDRPAPGEAFPGARRPGGGHLRWLVVDNAG